MPGLHTLADSAGSQADGQSGRGMPGQTDTNAINRQSSLRDRLRLWRNRLVASPGFRRSVARLPLLSRMAEGSANTLFRITSGFVHSQILFALVDLDILKRLARQPQDTDALASACDIEPARLLPLLEAGATLDLLARLDDGRWTVGDLGAVAASDAGIEAMVRHHAMLYRDLADPVGMVSGTAGETETHRFWAYAGERGDTVGNESAAAYSALMAASQSMLAEQVLDAYPFGRHRALLDIGGGSGAFVTAAGRRHPDLGLALFDLPPVAGEARNRLAAEAMGARVSCHGGDFFNDVLPTGYDVVTLVRILCDHDDEPAVRLLANIRRSMQQGDRLVIAEAMAGPAEGEKLAAAYFHLYFLAMGSGRCRSPRAIGELLRRAGFSSHRRIATPTRLLAGIVVAKP